MTDILWQPTATLESIKARAELLTSIRQFFSERQVLEVETPLLARYSVTDPHMDVLMADSPVGNGDRYYLQTSPEYAMKRLLASGLGSIYQIAKAFRRGEQGGRHNPEFTMLEWYRPGFTHHQLMDEVEALVASIIGCEHVFARKSYRQMFQQHFDFDPHLVDVGVVKAVAHQHLDVQMDSDNKDDWLNVLLAEIIEPALGVDVPIFIVDYPASQSALAKVSKDEAGVSIAQRFELYVDGVELANGYFELTDAEEQKKRFQHDQQLRADLGRAEMEQDKYLLAAMASGLPSCAGVAMGLDRLLMLAQGVVSINEVLAFPVDRA
ncbi:MAG TPA: EF-P lysine aminoacylase GenX [Porticoccus sp.]|nr:EF-P lysine aminoacylase GenX [Porticoccus sp.]